MVKQEIFKSYDVRGTYAEDLNEEAAFAVGRAFVTHTGAKKVVVGHDARISSPALFKALAEGICAAGATVYSIGQVPTECLYFAVGNYDFDGGIMITASHNPKQYNGFKMMRKEGDDIIWVRGKDLLSIAQENSVQEKPLADIVEKDIWPDYISHMNSFFDTNNIKPLTIVVDASNGVIGKAITLLKEALPCEIIELNFKPDGNFPNHSPNPLEEGSVNQIARAITEHKANFGIMFDGDADRIFLVDESGNLIMGDTTLLLLAKHFLKEHPGMGIAYNAVCSRAVREFVTTWGGVPVRTAVGFVNVREGLIKNNGIMGGETSCHYCFKDYFYMDSGIVAFVTLLQIISQDGRPVSEIMKELSPYKKVEMNFTVTDKDSVLEKIKATYANGKQDFLDGITVQYPDWWFNARSSNTEPLLRVAIEADTAEMLELKKKELSELIHP
jgi:phosphomannomutase